MSFNFGTQDPYVKTGLVGVAGGTVATLSNAGVNFGNALAVSNLATGGVIGTNAAGSVDAYSIFLCSQTTASQTLSLASPTITTENKVVIVSNVGTQAFTLLSQSVAAGTSIAAIWTGSAWSYIA